MKFLGVLAAVMILTTSANWETDMTIAQQKARDQHKFILLNFSGSDWCGPCIRMHKDIFENSAFEEFADSSLVLVNADFPRLKKNMLSKEQQKQNDALADKYNTDGAFPLTLLLDADGKVIKKWDGFPSETAAEFTNDVKAAADANH